MFAQDRPPKRKQSLGKSRETRSTRRQWWPRAAAQKSKAKQSRLDDTRQDEAVLARVTALYAQCEVKEAGLVRAGELCFCFLCIHVLCELLF